MRVLVTVASRHGSTAGLGDAVADVLVARGHEVIRREPADVVDLTAVDAVVLGSAVYMSRWLESARDLVARLGDQLRALPVWMFSSGPVGDAPVSAEGPRVQAQLAAVEPLDYQVFSGAIDSSRLDFRERSIVRMVRVTDGDFRDWDAVRAWAAGIADTLDAVSRPPRRSEA